MDLDLSINNNELCNGLGGTPGVSSIPIQQRMPLTEMRKIIHNNLLKILGTEQGTLTLVDSNFPCSLPMPINLIIFGQILYIQYYTMTAAIPGPRFDKIEYKTNKHAQAREIFGKWTDLP
jgi:hypothetical protein